MEDSKADAELARRELKRGGLAADWRVVETEPAFRRALAELRPHVILSDFALPGFNGSRALAIARELAPDTPFIFVSGTMGEEHAIRVLQQGATDYVLKGNLARLPAAVSRALEQVREREVRRRIERALRDSETGLRRAQAVAGLAHVIAGKGGVFESWSDTLPSLIGLAPREMPSSLREFLGFVHPEDRERFRAWAIKAAGLRARSELEYRLRHKDGGWMHVRQVSEPLDDMLDPDRGRRWFGTIQDITGQKQAAAALEESEARYRATFEQAAVGIVHTTLEGEIRMVNRAFCEMSGHARAEAVQLHIRDVTHPEDFAHSAEGRSQLLEGTGKPYQRELRLLRRDGSLLWVNVTTSLVRDAEGEPHHFVSVLNDVTERRVAERELRRFQAAMDITADSIYLTDPASMRFLYVNDTACRRLGYTREELMQKTSFEVVGKTPAEVEQEYRSVIAAGPLGTRSESRFLRKDGSEGWTELHRRMLEIDGGTVIVTIGRDITDRKRDEEELRRFRMAMDGSADIILLIDRATMKHVDCNDTACRLLGYSREELLSMGPADTLPVAREELERAYDEMISSGAASAGMNSYYRCKDGSRLPFESTRRLLRSGDSWLIVAISRDIRERLAQQTKIERLLRVHALMSGINSAIVRTRDRGELLREACRIAVEHGGFGIAQMLHYEPATFEVTPAAAAGIEPDIVKPAVIRPGAETISPRGTTIQSIRTRKPVYCNDITAEADIGSVRRAAVDRGYGSILSLPIVVDGEVSEVLLLCAREKNFFNAEELRLLEELAGDLAFALDYMAKEEKLNYLALHDSLTGLANRALLVDRLGQAMQEAGRQGAKFAVAALDLERLTTINESLGRHAGDALLRQVSQRLANAAGAASVARIAADHFVAVLPAVKGRSQAARAATELARACFAEPYLLEASELRIAAKTGLALFPNDGADADTLLANAEAALRKAKETGERQVLYTPALTERTGVSLTLENKLRRALENEEFVLHYQPKVEVETRRIVGMEALIRWQSPELGLVPPGKFIPLMEETGMILDVGNWALKRAARDHRLWTEAGLRPPRVAVNVSAIQMRQKDFVRSVEQAIVEGVSPTGIDLEITESLVMEDIEANIGKLREVRGLGVGLAIDDFGTGYSSLSYLARLPVQTLKIDRSFVITMLNEPDTMTLVQTVISLAHSLRLKVVAEGVDAEEQAKVLRLLRCDEMQGYLFSKPVTASQISALLGAGALPATDAPAGA